MLTNLQFEKLEMQWEFSSIELVSDYLLKKQQHNNDLFQASNDRESMNQLLDKLINRLGGAALYKVAAKPEHVPELANQRYPVTSPETSTRPMSVSDSKTGDVSLSGLSLADISLNNSSLKDEPLWLLEQPKQLRQRAKRPAYQGVLSLIHGPHRVTSHWWSTLYSRDYYIARQSSGRLIWVYYDRQQAEWYLHGLYA